MRRAALATALLILAVSCTNVPAATPTPIVQAVVAAAAPLDTPTPSPTPTLTPSPTPSPTPTPTPVATPRPEPIDRTMRRYNSQLAWRWLDPRELDCEDSGRCWGLLVRTRAACTQRLEATVAVRNAAGKRISMLRRQRPSVRKGQTLRFSLAAPQRSARSVTMGQLRCLQKPKPKPTPRPAPAPRRGCDTSYPTVCIPAYPPDLDCGQIPYRRFAVRGPDRHGFDGDNDGIGCES